MDRYGTILNTLHTYLLGHGKHNLIYGTNKKVASIKSILEVNGSQVEGSSHKQVVELIKVRNV